jgi:transcription elongation factor Elf1
MYQLEHDEIKFCRVCNNPTHTQAQQGEIKVNTWNETWDACFNSGMVIIKSDISS